MMTNDGENVPDTVRGSALEAWDSKGALYPYSPQLVGCIDRGLAIIEVASCPSRIQANIFYNNRLREKIHDLWEEAFNWACFTMNMSPTSVNAGPKSPYKMWHGTPQISQPRPFLRLVADRTKRSRKLEEHGRRGH